MATVNGYFTNRARHLDHREVNYPHRHRDGIEPQLGGEPSDGGAGELRVQGNLPGEWCIGIESVEDK